MSSDRFSKEEIERVAKWQFKGLEDAARLMSKRPPGQRFVGRWDWHFWMFLVTTCLPCFGVYCLAMWVRAGLWEKHRQREALKEKEASEKVEMDPQEQMAVMQREIENLKLLVLMHGKNSPQLSPESLRRLFTLETEKAKLEKMKQPEDKVEREVSYSDRIWNAIKPWLPFYVEPYYRRKEGPPPKTDFTALMKSDKSK